VLATLVALTGQERRGRKPDSEKGKGAEGEKLLRERRIMTSSGLTRWGGGALVLAGVSFITRSLLPADSRVGLTLHFVAIALLAVGMVGLHALQKNHYGRIGLVIGLAGVSIAIIAALASVVARIVILVSGSDALLPIVDLAGPGVMLGLLLCGVATLLAQVLPLWVGVGIIVALPLRFALFVIEPWGLTLFGLWWVVLGYVLWPRSETAAEQPSRVS